MTTVGPNIAGTGGAGTKTSSTFTWAGTTNITADDGVFATVTTDTTTGHFTQWLIASNFGFSLPAGAVIDGVTVQVKAKALNASRANVNEIRLGTISGTTFTSQTASQDNAIALPTTISTRTFGGSTDDWGYTGGLTSTILNASNFCVAYSIEVQGAAATTVSVDMIQVTIDYTPDASPTFTVQPSINYGSGSRIGSTNTPLNVTFTAHDDLTTGVNGLTYSIRTSATIGGGTQVGSGTCTSGTSKTHSLAYNATGLAAGSNTLWVQVNDGVNTAVASSSFIVLRDDVAPAASGTISTTPSAVPSNQQYTVTFTPSDATSTGANELDYEIRTAASGAGTLLTSGTATSGAAKTTSTITDTGLTTGSNTRYIRVLDGALHPTDTSFTVTYTPSVTYNDLGDIQDFTFNEISTIDKITLTETATPQVIAAVQSGAEGFYAGEMGALQTIVEVTTGSVDSANWHDSSNPDPHALGTITSVESQTENELTNPDAHALGTVGTDSIVLTETASPDPHALVTTSSLDSMTLTETGNLDAHALGTIGADTQVSNDLVSPQTITEVTTGVDGLNASDVSNPQVIASLQTGIESLNQSDTSNPQVLTSVQTGSVDQQVNNELGATQLLDFEETSSLESVGFVYDEFSNDVVLTFNTISGVDDFVGTDFGNQVLTFVTTISIESQTSTDTSSPLVLTLNEIGSDVFVVYDLADPIILVFNEIGTEQLTDNDLGSPQTLGFNTLGSETASVTDISNAQVIVSGQLGIEDFEQNELQSPQTLTFVTTKSVEQQTSNDFTPQILTFNTAGTDGQNSTDTSNSQIISEVTTGSIDHYVYNEFTNNVIELTFNVLWFEQQVRYDIGPAQTLVFNAVSAIDLLTATDVTNPAVLIMNTISSFSVAGFNDFLNPVVLVLLTTGTDTTGTAALDHYISSAFSVFQPYAESSIMVFDPYTGVLSTFEPYVNSSLIVKR
jgi:hypothetical protein